MTNRYTDTIFINKPLTCKNGDIKGFKTSCNNTYYLKLDLENEDKLDVIFDYLDKLEIDEVEDLDEMKKINIGFITDSSKKLHEFINEIKKQNLKEIQDIKIDNNIINQEIQNDEIKKHNLKEIQNDEINKINNSMNRKINNVKNTQTNIKTQKQQIQEIQNNIPINQEIQNDEDKIDEIDNSKKIQTIKSKTSKSKTKQSQQPLEQSQQPQQPQQITLREPQEQALKYMLSDEKHFFQIPCGCGKTTIYKEFINLRKNCGFLIVVPSINLAEQLIEKYFDEKTTGRYWTENNVEPKNPEEGFVIVCVANSFKKIPKEYIEKLNYVIYDEAHHDYSKTIYYNKEDKEPKIPKNEIKHTTIFNFSATFDIENSSIRLSDFYEYTFYQAVKKDYITPIHILFRQLDTKITKINKNQEMTPEQLEQSEERSDDLKNEKIQNIVQAIKSKNFKHTLILFNRIDTCSEICEILKKKLNKNVFIDYIVSKSGDIPATSKSERKRILNDFEKSKCGVLCSVNCIAEGVDIPCIDTVIFFDMRCGKISLPQAVGRCVRKYKDKKIGYVMCFFQKDDNDFNRLREVFFDRLLHYNNCFKSDNLTEFIDIEKMKNQTFFERLTGKNKIESLTDLKTKFINSYINSNFIKEKILDIDFLEKIFTDFFKCKSKLCNFEPFIIKNNNLVYNLESLKDLYCKFPWFNELIQNILRNLNYKEIQIEGFLKYIIETKEQIKKKAHVIPGNEKIIINGYVFENSKISVPTKPLPKEKKPEADARYFNDDFEGFKKYYFTDNTLFIC